MTTDLSMLAWTTGLTIVLWLPYIVAHIGDVGFMPALTYQADDIPLPDWAGRAKKAHANAVANLAPFAALVIVAHIAGAANEATAAASIAFFWARVAHYPLYILNVPFARTTTFTICWLAMVCIFWQIVS
jgi:uncharacterized MAPEG superfamily protein